MDILTVQFTKFYDVSRQMKKREKEKEGRKEGLGGS